MRGFGGRHPPLSPPKKSASEAARLEEVLVKPPDMYGGITKNDSQELKAMYLTNRKQESVSTFFVVHSGFGVGMRRSCIIFIYFSSLFLSAM